MGYRRCASNAGSVYSDELLRLFGDISLLLEVGFYFANGNWKKLAEASGLFCSQALGDPIQLIQIAEGNNHLACIPGVDLDTYRSGKGIG
jgi:hypothetical protein